MISLVFIREKTNNTNFKRNSFTEAVNHRNISEGQLNLLQQILVNL